MGKALKNCPENLETWKQFQVHFWKEKACFYSKYDILSDLKTDKDKK